MRQRSAWAWPNVAAIRHALGVLLAALLASLVVAAPAHAQAEFPPACQLPAGWSVPAGATTGWVVAFDSVISGTCSLKSAPMSNSPGPGVYNKAQIEFTASFSSNALTFARRVSSETTYDCLRLFIDGVEQDIGAQCNSNGHLGLSGDIPWAVETIPIADGTHTIRWSYEKDFSVSGGADAAWIDNVAIVPLGAGEFPQNCQLPAGWTVPGGATTGWHVDFSTAQEGSCSLKSNAMSSSGGAGLFNKAQIQFTGSFSSNALRFARRVSSEGTFDCLRLFIDGVEKDIGAQCDANGSLGISGEIPWALDTIPLPDGTHTIMWSYEKDESASLGLDAAWIDNVAIIPLSAVPEFPPHCVIPNDWTTPTYGAGAGWIVASDTVNFGECSLKSEAIGDVARAEIQFSATFDAGTISFARRVSSQDGYDCLKFLIDGVEQAIGSNCTFHGGTGASGEVPWGTVSIPIAAGTHTLRWSYQKDEFGAGGFDAAWIDDVVLPPFVAIPPLTLPGPPTLGLVGRTSSNAQFTYSPPLNDGGSPIIGYIVRWRVRNTTAFVGEIEAAAPPSPFEITGLSPVSYDVFLSAVSANGEGEPAFVVLQSDQAITFNPLSGKTYGDPPFTISATASSGLPVSFSSLTGPVCTVSGSTVTLLAVGTCTIAANQAGDAGYFPAPQVTQSFSVVKASQTISFGALAGKIFGDPPFTVAATATSGLAVTFSSGTPGICTVSGATVTIVAAGICTVNADQAGNANYDPAPQVSQSFTVAKAAQLISFNPLGNKTIGDPPFTVLATASSGLTVVFGSLTSSTCTVSGTTVTLVAVGTCAITADQPGDANYDPAAQVPRSFDVAPPGTFPLTVTKAGTGDGTVASDVSGINCGAACSFSFTSGTVVTLGAVADAESAFSGWSGEGCTGTDACQVTMSAARNVTATFTSMRKASQTITFGALAGKIYGDPPFIVTATASSGLPVTFTSATTAVCTVSGSTVTIVAAGTCTINANQAGDATYDPAPQVSQSFSVAKANQTIAFGALGSKTFGDAPFSVSATATSGLAVTFTSVTAAVCTLSGTTVSILAAGTCTLNANQAGNANYNPAPQVSRSFTVAKSAQAITFNAIPNKTIGDAPFTISATASSGLVVTFSSLKPLTCTVSGTTVTLVAVGTCTIAADQSGNANYNPAPQVTQTFTVAKASQTITFNALPGKTLVESPFTVSATASSGLAVAFSSLTAPVCTVSGTTVTLVTAGTCTIAADQSGDANYSAAPQVTQSFSVVKANQTISFGALADKTLADAPFAISASASSGLTVAFTSLTTSVCTVSGTTVTLVAAGTCTIAANQAGNATYNAAPQVTQGFSVVKASQTISFGALADKTLADAPFAISASASSGLTVAFTSLTNSVCTVSGTTVTLVATGTCTIAANQAGNANYNPAPQVTQSFGVAKANQAISFGALATKIFGDAPFGISATATSGLAVSFTSATTLVCTVSGSTVTIVAAGTCTVNANQAGNATYNAAVQVSQSFTVAKASQTITFNPIPGKTFGTDGPFTISASASSGLTVTFTSQIPSVCTVSGTTVTLVAAGTCTIAADQPGDGNYLAAAQVTQSFQVGTPGTFPLTVTKTGTGTGTITSSPAGISCGATCTASFTSPTVVSLTPAAGTNSVFTSWGGDCSGSAGCSVTMSAARNVTATFTSTAKTPQTISFGALATKAFGDAPFTVTATATSGLPVTFTSATTPVCTVSGSTVTILTLGTCTINANQAGDATYDPAPQVSQTFSVVKANQTISFGALAGKNFGDPPFTVAATATSGLAVTFSSSTPGVCTVSGTTVTIVAVGSCMVNADQAGNANYSAALTVPQSFNVVKASQTISFGALAAKTFGDAPFTVTATASSGLPVALTSATTGVCTVSGTTVTIVAVGTCTVNANQAGNPNYNAAPQVAQSFNVATANQTITFGALTSKTFGDAPFAISATATSGLVVTFTSATTGVCTVSGTTVTIVAVGTCTINANQPGNGNYNAAPQVAQSFAVAKANQAITFNALANKTFGDVPFTISATSSSGLPVAFTSVAVCTVSGTTVTLLAAGICTINANQAGDANYNPAPQVSQSFTVAKLGQAITFNALPGKTIGDPDFTISATASSGLVVTFSSLTPTCTVSGTTVTLVVSGTCTIAADQAGDANYLAAPRVSRSFEVAPLNTYTLTVTKAGSGAGTVTSSTAGISCGPTCAFNFTSGTVVTLTAVAAAGSSFSGWSGACTGTGGCTVAMDSAKAVTATFTANQTGTLVTRYRLYSPGTLEHLYTTDFNEYSVLPVCCMWNPEGAIYKVFNGPGSFNGVAATPYYRLYNPSSFQHHWTTDLNEYTVLATVGWRQEGIDGYILPTPVAGALPVYRLYISVFGGLHLWTTDVNEKNYLTANAGWVDEGIAGYVIPLP